MRVPCSVARFPAHVASVLPDRLCRVGPAANHPALLPYLPVVFPCTSLLRALSYTPLCFLQTRHVGARISAIPVGCLTCLYSIPRRGRPRSRFHPSLRAHRRVCWPGRCPLQGDGSCRSCSLSAICFGASCPPV